jgi:hypothetical protein
VENTPPEARKNPTEGQLKESSVSEIAEELCPEKTHLTLFRKIILSARSLVK